MFHTSTFMHQIVAGLAVLLLLQLSVGVAGIRPTDDSWRHLRHRLQIEQPVATNPTTTSHGALATKMWSSEAGSEVPGDMATWQSKGVQHSLHPTHNVEVRSGMHVVCRGLPGW